EKKEPGNFHDTLAHELAHASDEVFKNPQYNTKNYYCSCKTKKMLGKYHRGEGHDKIWHDKYDEFREKIKNEKLADGSSYQALGKDFVLSKYKDNSNKDDPEENLTSPSETSNKEKIFW
ncbi:6851_t:CDS:1, partial [Ambispora leptoticha]